MVNIFSFRFNRTSSRTRRHFKT